MRPLAVAGAIALVWALAVVALSFGTHDVTFRGTGSFTPNGDFRTVDARGVRTIRYGTWSGDDAKHGTGASDVFRAPLAVTVKVAGGTARPDERVVLRRVDDGATIRFAESEDAGERYVTQFRLLPPSWWGRPVQFVATDDGAGARGWIGIADAGAPTAGELLGAAPYPLLLVAALLFGVPSVVAGMWIARRSGIAGDAPAFACALVVLAAAGMVAFFAARFTPLGAAAGIVVEVALLAGAAAAVRDAALRNALRARTAWAPIALSTGVAFAYAALLAAATPMGGDMITTSSSAWLPLPGDDVLPQMLARQAETHAAPRPFSGDWLSSDRPPLQAGIAVIADAVIPGPEDVRYECVALWLQTLAFGAIWAVARALGADARRAAWATVLCVPVGFFFINSVFTWPKLLSAALGVAAIVLVCAPDARARSRYALAGAALALAMLAHGGVVFTVPALAAAAIIRERRAALSGLAVAAVVALAVYAPWAAYQRFYDPPGDRLIKMHLAGIVAPDPGESAVHAIVRAYASAGAGTVVALRLANFRSVFSGTYGARNDEFFFVLPAIGLFIVPLGFALAERRRERGTTAIALIGVASIALWCVTKWTYAVVHEGSYLTMVLLFAAGALTATRVPIAGRALFSIQVAAFVAIWCWGVVQPVALLAQVCAAALCAFTAVCLVGAFSSPYVENGDTRG